MTVNYMLGSGPVKWVTTEWLQEHLLDEEIMILDAQPNVHDYFEAHIPGAGYMDEGLLRVGKNGMPAVYVPEVVIEQIAGRLGLRADVPVVVYTGKGPFSGKGNGLEQTMVAYTLARFGHNNVYLLDGGFEKWKNENRATSKVFPITKESQFKAEVRSDYFISMKKLKEIIDNGDVVLLDVRPPDAYAGQNVWIKPGHIPGAVNLFWKMLMEKENPCKLKSLTEIQKIADEYSLSADKTIICSCGTGREATNAFLVFKFLLGFPNVKLYEGSFTEWSAYPENETVTGPLPK